MTANFQFTERSKKIWPYYHEVLAENSALWADQYALTMAQALFASGKHDINTTFHQYVRKNPFKGGYILTAGQNVVFEWMKNNWKFDETDIAILREEKATDPTTGKMTRLYTDNFLDMLAHSKFELTVDALPEGEISFPDEPIWRVNGPVWQCLMVEACILNVTNSQSLFATLASRLCAATGGEPVLEFGLRRAQTAGGLEPSRAAYVGGSAGTSNMLAKKHYGIPSVGTMAHALVMLYENESEAFYDYAKAMPNNFVALPDTYDTLSGIQKAVQVCKETGTILKGIRLDSGDFVKLSIQGRKILDENGLKDAKITASNDLDVESVLDLKARGAEIDIWALGTNLVTSKEQPALGGVYKLGAVFDYNRTLSQQELDKLKEGVQSGIYNPSALDRYVRETIKISGDSIKTSIPGELDIIRHMKEIDGTFVMEGDTIISNLQQSPLQNGYLHQPISSIPKTDTEHDRLYPEGSLAYRPLQHMFEKGRLVGEIKTVHDARLQAQHSLSMLQSNYKSLTTPEIYPVGLERSLHDKRREMIYSVSTLKAA